MYPSSNDEKNSRGCSSTHIEGDNNIKIDEGKVKETSRNNDIPFDTGNVSDASPPRRPRPHPASASRQTRAVPSTRDQDEKEISDASPPRRRVRSRDSGRYPSAAETRPRKRSRSIEGRRFSTDKMARRTSHSSATDDDLTSVRSGANPVASSSPRERLVSHRQTATRFPHFRNPFAQRAPPNRYGILPGPRWDGIERTNGFEVRLENMRAEKRSTDYQAYRASVADL
ncbi:hypothetical protein FGB62_25g48 [Gracilaria domingensis]|nr:hypothetical protein FGB62_25g48 [Gracilaria domingensis]